MAFRFIALGIFTSLYFYLDWTLGSAFSQLAPRLIIYFILFSLFVIILWIPLVYWRRDREKTTKIERTLLQLGFSGVGFLSFILVLAATRDALAAVLPSAHLHTEGVTLGILGAAATLFFTGVYNAHRRVQIRTTHLPIAGLPEELDGFRIVQISDLHIGPTLKKNFAQKIADQANSCHPDLIALTGDMVDGMVSDLKEDVAPLSHLKSKYGVYYVTGNHEYYWEGNAWVEKFKTLGIIPLLNQHTVIKANGKELVLAGVPDFTAKAMGLEGPDPKKALHGAPSSAFPKILLCHQPKLAPETEANGYDIQLSGHTHGGQFFPWTWVVSWVHRFPHGLHQLGKLWVYVSRGTGYWGPPVRLGAQAEISVLVLQHFNASAPTP